MMCTGTLKKFLRNVCMFVSFQNFIDFDIEVNCVMNVMKEVASRYVFTEHLTSLQRVHKMKPVMLWI